MGQYTHILVGTDLSLEAEHVIAQALHLAQSHDAHLSLLHSIAGDADYFQERLPLKPEEFEEMLRQETRRKIIEMFGDSEIGELLQDIRIALGKPYKELLNFASSEDVDLLVVGPRHPSLMKRLMLGSTTEKLLRHSPVPTLILHPHREPGSFEKILAPVDLSEASRQSMEHAADLARQEGAELHVLHVCEETPVSSLVGFLPMAEAGGLYAMYEEGAREEFDLFLGGVDVGGVEYEKHFRTGHATAQIIECCDELQCDLIVIGTVGRVGIEGLLVGNTAERIAHSLPCSVLTVRPKVVPQEIAELPVAPAV